VGVALTGATVTAIAGRLHRTEEEVRILLE
jgi:hypothetical protein